MASREQLGLAAFTANFVAGIERGLQARRERNVEKQKLDIQRRELAIKAKKSQEVDPFRQEFLQQKRESLDLKKSQRIDRLRSDRRGALKDLASTTTQLAEVTGQLTGDNVPETKKQRLGPMFLRLKELEQLQKNELADIDDEIFSFSGGFRGRKKEDPVDDRLEKIQQEVEEAPVPVSDQEPFDDIPPQFRTQFENIEKFKFQNTPQILNLAKQESRKITDPATLEKFKEMVASIIAEKRIEKQREAEEEAEQDRRLQLERSAGLK